ncbi:MAG: hypothetical protein JSS20_14350 [Proteobacteria bacterium]|nr:hypothetical protein [Pseudomonadota bacterium]
MQLMVMLAPDTVGHLANTVKGYALAIGTAFAMWFVWMWWKVRVDEARSERSARARAAWSRYLSTALQNPELAEPMIGSLSSPVEVARYRSFVATLLAVGDEILALEPTKAWRDTLARHLAPHSSYLGSHEFQSSGLADCTEEVRGIVRSVAGV